MHKSRLVVKPHRPRRARAIGLFLAVFGVISGFLLFEYGQYRGGYNEVVAGRQADALHARIAALGAENDRLRQRIAVLETSLQVDHEAYQEVEGTLADLQNEIQTQREELAFYRGIVRPPEGETGLQIREFALTPVQQASRYRLRMVLVQASRHDRRISGVVSLSVDGAMDGSPKSYEMAELTPGESEPLGFSFRYFQDLERDLVLPEGFVPDRVNVEVSPRGRRAKIIRRSFDWTTQQS